jgi:hypothetical protein
MRDQDGGWDAKVGGGGGEGGGDSRFISIPIVMGAGGSELKM